MPIRITSQKLQELLTGKEEFEIKDPVKCWCDGQACSFQSDGFGLLNASSQCKHCARVDAVQILKFLLDKAGGNKPLRDKTIKEMLQEIFYEQVEEISVAELLTRFLDSADDISADVNEYVKSQIAALIKFLELNEKKVWCEPNDE